MLGLVPRGAQALRRRALPDRPGNVARVVSHIAYQPSEGTLELEADFVVVGSGAGGATAAVDARARRARSVAHRRGRRLARPARLPDSTYGAMRDLFDDWGSTITRGRAFWPVVQARARRRHHRHQLRDRRPHAGRHLRRSGRSEHGVGGDAMAERGLAPPGRARARALRRGRARRLAGPLEPARDARAPPRLGYDVARTCTRYAKGCVGSGQCLQGCRSLQEAEHQPQLTSPRCCARGGDVLSMRAGRSGSLFEGRRAVGVTGRFRHPRPARERRALRWRARARRRCSSRPRSPTRPVAAPALGRPEQRALGEHFRAHPGTGVFGVYDEPVDMNVGATQGWASTAFRDEPGLKLETLAIPPEMVAGALPGGGVELMERLAEYRHLAMWVPRRARRVGGHGRERLRRQAGGPLHPRSRRHGALPRGHGPGRARRTSPPARARSSPASSGCRTSSAPDERAPPRGRARSIRAATSPSSRTSSAAA